MYFSPALSTVFVHVPKTAGTSIMRAFEGVADDVELVGRKHDGVRSKSFRSLPKDATTFAVTRDPYDRCLSWYGMVLRTSSTAISGEPTKFRRLCDELAAAGSLNNFVSMLLDDYGEHGEKGRFRLIGRPQTYYLTRKDSGPIHVDQLLRFESLEADISQFFSSIRTQEEVSLPALNSSWWQRKQIDLDSASKTLIEALYEEDFERFSYARVSDSPG